VKVILSAHKDIPSDAPTEVRRGRLAGLLDNAVGVMAAGAVIHAYDEVHLGCEEREYRYLDRRGMAARVEKQDRYSLAGELGRRSNPGDLFVVILDVCCCRHARGNPLVIENWHRAPIALLRRIQQRHSVSFRARHLADQDESAVLRALNVPGFVVIFNVAPSGKSEPVPWHGPCRARVADFDRLVRLLAELPALVRESVPRARSVRSAGTTRATRTQPKYA
jgi:hypothetical protein